MPPRPSSPFSAALALTAILVACGDSGTSTEPRPPSLTLGAATISLSAPAAGDPASVDVAVGNGGDGTLDGLTVSVSYPAGEPAGWLDATLDRTSAPATVRLDARPGPLSSMLGATVTVHAAGIGAQEDLPVSFEVTPDPYLYLIDHDTDVLQRMDPETLAITDVGPLGVAFNFGDCAWEPASRTLYMVDGRAANTLYTVDLATGAATAVGVHGIRDLFAVEIHAPTGVLYAAAGIGADWVLYRLDRSTAAATAIGGLTNYVHGMAWDAGREVMVAVRGSNVGGFFMTVDLETAALTYVAGTIPFDNHGITYDPIRDLLWGADYSGGIFQFDPAASYAGTLVASDTGRHTCMAYVP